MMHKAKQSKVTIYFAVWREGFRKDLIEFLATVELKKLERNWSGAELQAF